MLTRRTLIGHGMIWPVLGSWVASAYAEPGLPSPALWIIDRHRPGAAAISASAQSKRAEIHEFGTDPGQVWMNVLAPRLQRAPLAIGGHTSASVLFCLHYLARDFGMTLAHIAGGASRTETAGSYDPRALIDLRDPRFGNRDAAYTWLMLPRSA